MWKNADPAHQGVELGGITNSTSTSSAKVTPPPPQSCPPRPFGSNIATVGNERRSFWLHGVEDGLAREASGLKRVASSRPRLETVQEVQRTSVEVVVGVHPRGAPGVAPNPAPRAPLHGARDRRHAGKKVEAHRAQVGATRTSTTNRARRVSHPRADWESRPSCIPAPCQSGPRASRIVAHRNPGNASAISHPCSVDQEHEERAGDPCATTPIRSAARARSSKVFS